jgi:uncharacterized repeat protein (TIGR01451 family)
VARHDNNNNPLLRRIKVNVADETITAVAGQNGTFTIMVTDCGPSDVTDAVICESLPDTFSGVTLHRDKRGGASNRARNCGSGLFCNVFI